jgi:type VI secretion system secreted protein Hcp
MAADNFLKVTGAAGESQDKDHAGEIEVLSWSFGESNSGTAASGGGAGAGKVNFQDFTFSATMGKHTPCLAKACATGTHIDSAVLVCRKAGGGQQEFLKITFTDFLVSSYQTGGSSGGEVPIETFSFNYSKIEMAYKEQKADGSLGGATQFAYDLKKSAAT